MNEILRIMSNDVRKVYNEQGQAADPRTIKYVVKVLRTGFEFINKLVMVYVHIEEGMVPFVVNNDPFTDGNLYYNCIQTCIKKLNEQLYEIDEPRRLDNLTGYCRRACRFFSHAVIYFELSERNIEG